MRDEFEAIYDEFVECEDEDIQEEEDSVFTYEGIPIPPVHERLLFVKFAHFSCLPKMARKEQGLPTSDRGFAEEFGVAARTLANWKKYPAFNDLQEHFTRLYNRSVTHQIIRTMGSVAQQQDPRAHNDRIAYLRMAGVVKDEKHVHSQVDVKVTHQSARTMKEGDMRRYLMEKYKGDDRLKGASDEQIEHFVNVLFDVNTEETRSAGRALPSSSDEEVAAAQEFILHMPDPGDFN